MTILFMGGEMGAFTPSDSTVVEKVEAGRYDPAFARCAIYTGARGSVVYAETAAWTAEDEAYLHFEVEANPAGSADTLVSLMAGSDAQIRILATVSGDNVIHQPQYLSALAVWTNIGTAITIPNEKQVIDLYWKIDASGEVRYFVAGNERITGTADLSHLSDITSARLHSLFDPSRFSQVVADTDPTVGGRLFTVPVSGAGATSSWIGSYAELDEIVYSDADFINSGTANQVSTFAVSAPTLTGYSVRAVAVTARARRGAGGPQNLQLALRVSGTDYFSSSKALGIGYGAFVNIWEQNPATTADWVNTAISTLQPGAKSIT